MSENWNLIIRWIAPVDLAGTVNLEVFGIEENMHQNSARVESAENQASPRHSSSQTCRKPTPRVKVDKGLSEITVLPSLESDYLTSKNLFPPLHLVFIIQGALQVQSATRLGSPEASKGELTLKDQSHDPPRALKLTGVRVACTWLRRRAELALSPFVASCSVLETIDDRLIRCGISAVAPSCSSAVLLWLLHHSGLRSLTRRLRKT